MLQFDSPKGKSSIIKVLGIGGGGNNAVNYMYNLGIEGVDFIICNTDSQVLSDSPIPVKIQLGERKLGAGAMPDVGREATTESVEKIRKALEDETQMLFITAGMGGGTGTGGAPVIAALAREMGILTVGIVSIPFSFEGKKRRLQAQEGIDELKKHVDTLLVISNDKLRDMYGNLKLSEAFGKADNILATAAKGISEIITVRGYINVDFEDVKTVMKDSGTAIMGSGTAEGEDRARVAIEEALNSPLLNDNVIKGAKDILLYIASGEEEIEMDEITEITDFIQQQAGENIDIIWGTGKVNDFGNKIAISLIATGFESKETDIGFTGIKQVKKKITVLYNGNEKDEKEVKKDDNNENIVGDEAALTTNIERITNPDSVFKKMKAIKQNELMNKVEKESEKKNENIVGEEVALNTDFGRITNPDIVFEKMGGVKHNELNNKEDNESIEKNRVHTLFTKESKQKVNEKIYQEANEEKLYAEEVKPAYETKHNLYDTNKLEEEIVGKDIFIEKKEVEKISEPQSKAIKDALERKMQLREMSLNLRKDKELEETPAYIRKNIKLEDELYSGEKNISEYTISEDKDDIELKSGNSFIHKDVD